MRREDQDFALSWMNLMASLTVVIFSAASSGISTPNSSSKAMTSSTMSRLSAPRSSMKLASSVTLSGSTPRCSTTIFLTRSEVSLIVHLSLEVFVGDCPSRSQVQKASGSGSGGSKRQAAFDPLDDRERAEIIADQQGFALHHFRRYHVADQGRDRRIAGGRAHRGEAGGAEFVALAGEPEVERFRLDAAGRKPVVKDGAHEQGRGITAGGLAPGARPVLAVGAGLQGSG